MKGSHITSPILGFGLLAAISSSLWIYPETAAADTFGAQVHAVTSHADLGGKKLSVPRAVEEPAALAERNLRLDGDGQLVGGGVRGELLFDETRFGLGFNFFRVSEVELAHDPLPPGLSIEAGRGFGMTWELFLGRELGQGPVYPYLDLRVVLGLVNTQVKTNAEPYGHVGTTDYNFWSIGLGPRLGMLVPIGHSTMLDFALYHQLIGGIETVTAFAGIGFWENDRKDYFSQSLRGGSTGDI